MRRYFKGLIVLLFATYLGYSRYRISQVIAKNWFEEALSTSICICLSSSSARTPEDNPLFKGRLVFLTDRYEFSNHTEQYREGFLEFRNVVHRDGPCGNLSIPPRKRPCTPLLHIHLYQRELFTVHQGSLWLSVRWADLFLRCPIRVLRLFTLNRWPPHTFWMADNQEDLVLTIRVEPIFGDIGLSRKSFENIIGTQRDKLMSFWQALVFLDNIQTYPIGLSTTCDEISLSTRCFYRSFY